MEQGTSDQKRRWAECNLKVFSAAIGHKWRRHVAAHRWFQNTEGLISGTQQTELTELTVATLMTLPIMLGEWQGATWGTCRDTWPAGEPADTRARAILWWTARLDRYTWLERMTFQTFHLGFIRFRLEIWSWIIVLFFLHNIEILFCAFWTQNDKDLCLYKTCPTHEENE